MEGYLDEKQLDRIAVDVDKLLMKIMELKLHGAKVALLSISEPIEDTDIGKNIMVDAIGISCGGITDFNVVSGVTEEELDKAYWCE